MKKLNYLVAAMLSFTVSSFAIADPVEHFEAKSAETLEQAVTNFTQYNQRLKKILSQPSITAEDLGSIHELTYTLETALAKITQELDGLATSLEEVHLASEDNDADAVKKSAEAYLQTTDVLTIGR